MKEGKLVNISKFTDFLHRFTLITTLSFGEKIDWVEITID